MPVATKNPPTRNPTAKPGSAAKKPKKPKKAGASDTWLIVILDRSGSMQSIRGDMEGGMNHFVSEQAKLPGKCDFTLVQFDAEGGYRSNIETVHDHIPIGTVPPIVLSPRGSTPLMDAVGITLSTCGSAWEGHGSPDTVVVIVTDGEENASREWTREKVKSLTQELTGKGWQFIYLGANQDSFAEARAMGISFDSTADYSATPGGTMSAAYSVTNSVARYRGSGGMSVSFTEDEREAMTNAEDTTT